MKQIFRMAALVLFLGATGLSAPACTPDASDTCDARCDCEGCSGREYDACVDDWYDDERRSADRRCLPEFDDYIACQEATWQCRGGDYETDCRRERDRWRDCID